MTNLIDTEVDLATLMVLKGYVDNTTIYNFFKDSKCWRTDRKDVPESTNREPLMWTKTKHLKKVVDALEVDSISNIRPNGFSNAILFRTSNKGQTQRLEKEISTAMRLKESTLTEDGRIRIYENETFVFKVAQYQIQGYDLFALVIMNRTDYEDGLNIQ
jgi:hypothetical protein